MLSASLVAPARAGEPEDKYRLSFEGPQGEVHNSEPNRVVCLLEHEGPGEGAMAWTVSIGGFGTGPESLAGFDTEGAAAQDAEFARVEAAERGEGDCERFDFRLIAAVVLSSVEPIALPPNESHSILFIDVVLAPFFDAPQVRRGDGGGAKVIPTVYLMYADGCAVGEEVFANSVTDAAGDHTPALGALELIGTLGTNHVPFVRGDANQDGRVDLSDAVWILGELFLGFESLQCPGALDSDGSFAVDISDAVYLASHLSPRGTAASRSVPDLRLRSGARLPLRRVPRVLRLNALGGPPMRAVRASIAAAFWSAVSLVAHSALEARTITVGESPQAEFRSIQTALDRAGDGDTVLVEPGEYVLSEPLEINRLHDPSNPASPPLKNIVLQASGGPDATSICVAEPPADRGRSLAFLFDKGEDARTVVEGFSVEGGAGYSLFASGAWRSLGSAVVCIDSSPALRNCRFVAAPRAVARSLVHLEGSSAWLLDCTLEGGGTGLHCTGGSPRLERCRIADTFGGADIRRSSPAFIECTFENNADRSGLRIADGSSAELIDCLLLGNDGEPGGGFYASDGSSVRLLGCILEGNAADDGGGAFALDGATATIIASRIIGNYGDQGGGAFECSRSTVHLDSCLIAGNHGDHAGGVFSAASSTATLVHCTVSGNAQLEGGSIIDAFDATVTLRGAILWGNAGDLISLAGGSRLDASFSCIQGAPLPGEGNRSDDPLFVEPGRYDFSRLTYRPSFIVSAGDYRLRSDSPCIDIAPAGGAPTVDLDGAARPCGPSADAGAFEFGNCHPVRFLRGDTDASGTRDLADAVRLLSFLFRGGDPPECRDAADVDDDGRLLLTDPIRLLGFLFLGSPPPPAPFAGCGPDRTADGLDCVAFGACE